MHLPLLGSSSNFALLSYIGHACPYMNVDGFGESVVEWGRGCCYIRFVDKFTLKEDAFALLASSSQFALLTYIGSGAFTCSL
jgi:hypothetical protein